MKSLILKIIRNKNLLSLSGNMAAAGFQFLNFVILARILSVEEFGKWGLFIAASSLTDMLRFGLTRNAIVRFLAGANHDDRKITLGSCYSISLLSSLPIIILFIPFYFLFQDFIYASDFVYYFIWYPFLALAAIPFNNAISALRAEQRFMELLVIRVLIFGGFTIVLAYIFFLYSANTSEIILVFIGINLLSGIFISILNWDGVLFLFKSTRKRVAEILNFGKFSIGSIIGSHLLKSADTLIIGMSALGSSLVSYYLIPLKFTEILEIPLRSFLATAYPQMASESKKGNKEKLIQILYRYVFLVTLLFIPIALGGFWLAKYFILIVGGEQYATNPICITVLRIFTLYSLFLPLDRFVGVALDSINKPKYNFYKVLVMLAANILGDIIAIFIFQSLEMVAFTTVLFTLIGIFIGMKYLSKHVPIKLGDILPYGKEVLQEKLKYKLSR